MTEPTAVAAPRVYIADLGAYVAGRLRGQWFTPTDFDDAEAFEGAVGAYIAQRPGAEEWAIHDYDNWGSLRLGEYEELSRIHRLAGLIKEHGSAFIAYVENVGIDYASLEGFQDDYHGQYESGADYARESNEDIHSGQLERLPDELRYRIDWEGVWFDLDQNGWRITEDGHVFGP